MIEEMSIPEMTRVFEMLHATNPGLVKALVGVRVWLAGGAVRDSLRAVAPRDVDLWVTDVDTQSEVVGILQQEGYELLKHERSVVTLQDGFRPSVQVIHTSIPQLHQLVANFDFHINAAGIDLNQRTGYVSDRFRADLTVLRITLQNGRKANLERTLDFHNRGFAIDPGILGEFARQLDANERDLTDILTGGVFDEAYEQAGKS